MRRIWLAAMLSVWLCAQAGCYDSTGPDTTAYSPRVASAYQLECPQPPTDLNELIRSYTDQLRDVVKPEPDQPPVQPALAPQPYVPASVPLLPFEEPGAQSTAPAYPFGPDRPTRVIPPEAVSAVILPPPIEELPPEPEAPSATQLPATQPAVGPSAAPVESTANLEDVIAYYEGLAASRPEDLQLQLRLRMMYLADHQDEKALAPLGAVSQKESDQVLSILRAMIAVRDGSGVENADPAGLLLALQTLQDRLMAVADMQIPALKLCKLVTGYGQYVPFPTNEFPARRSQPVIVYAELRNYTAAVDEAGLYRTRLNMAVNLYDSAGQLVNGLSRQDKDITDVSANRRSDFFLTRRVYLPDTLAPGQYTLKVTVEDPTANKAATASTAITLK